MQCIGYMATVSDATSPSGWRLPRGRHPLIQFLRACLANVSFTMDPSSQDCFQWRHTPNSTPGLFSTAKTWESLHPSPPPVSWFKSVWFSFNIPKHAFLTWIVSRNRLPTRDRLLGWGMNVPSSCLLCASVDESRSHLFFQCPFSNQVWTSFFTYHSLTPPHSFDGSINWVMTASPNGKVKTICKLLLQAVIYAIWRERNLRLHTSANRPVQLLIRETQVIMKAKLIGMDRLSAQNLRSPQSQTTQESYLAVWFHYFQP